MQKQKKEHTSDMVDILNVCFELHQHLHVKLITNIESKIHTHKGNKLIAT